MDDPTSIVYGSALTQSYIALPYVTSHLTTMAFIVNQFTHDRTRTIDLVYAVCSGDAAQHLDILSHHMSNVTDQREAAK